VVKYIRQQQRDGARLILWTNRMDGRLEEAVTWCREQGITFDAVNENLPEIVERFGGDCRKIFADVYLDDRAMVPEEAERRSRFARTVRRGR
jgi:hypothetical protein